MAKNPDVTPSIKAIAKQLWAAESLESKAAWKSWADAEMQDEHPPMIKISKEFDPMPVASASGSDSESSAKGRKPQGDSEDPELIGKKQSKWKTVKQIQEELVSRDLEKAGKKEVIVKRLQDAIHRQQNTEIEEPGNSEAESSEDEDSLEDDED
tara:strand:- start:314 stop:775 length:462 start_codon:yes stop_codon:yes gene_type:complete